MAGSLLFCAFSLHLPHLFDYSSVSALLNVSPIGAETPGWFLAFLPSVELAKGHGKDSINIWKEGKEEGGGRKEEPRTWKSVLENFPLKHHLMQVDQTSKAPSRSWGWGGGCCRA